MKIEEQDYLDGRVLDQMNWYSNKSTTNKRFHLWTRGLVIVFSIMIPFAAGFIETNPTYLYLNSTVGLLGVISAILIGLSALMKFQEKWIKYRTSSEAMKYEKHLYLTRSGHYKEAKDPFNLFVMRIENIIINENAIWSDYIRKEE